MKLALTLALQGDPALVEAQLSLHLNAGVDVVLAVAPDSGAWEEGLAPYRADGLVHLVQERADATALRSRLAGIAAAEHGADWIVECGPGEFWWPRAESLKEVLDPIPERYAIVRGLVRPLLARGNEGSFEERFVVRRVLRSPADVGAAPEDVLRPMFRAQRALAAGGDLEGGLLVPLRAWYPVEVFRVPAGADGAGDVEGVEQGLADGSLVEDTRLRDALRSLRGSAEAGFAPPGKEGPRLRFPLPDVVDDAAYAVECAAVGEVDLQRLEARIDELELRLGQLERGLWPRVVARLARVARPRSA